MPAGEQGDEEPIHQIALTDDVVGKVRAQGGNGGGFGHRRACSVGGVAGEALDYVEESSRGSSGGQAGVKRAGVAASTTADAAWCGARVLLPDNLVIKASRLVH